ncbi:hypothetical protein F528_2505, partial [Neisseria meningitidis 992008]
MLEKATGRLNLQTAFVFPTASNRRQVADFGQ